MNYTELQVTTNFSFLRGGSHPEELIEQAAAYGYRQIAITDRNSLAGIVRAHVAAKAKGIKMITGCRLDLKDGASLLAYPTNKEGYEQLCLLLTKGNIRTEKGKCELYKQDVYAHRTAIKFIIVPPANLNVLFDFDEAFKQDVEAYYEMFGSEVYLGATRAYQSNDY